MGKTREYIKTQWPKLHLDKRTTVICSILGFLISVAGVFLVVQSLEASNETASTDTYLKTYEYAINIDKAMVDSPTLKKCLMKSSIEPAAGDTAKAVALAEWMLDSYDAVLNNDSYFKIDSLTGKQWIKTVAKKFHDYPILDKVFPRDSDLYGDRLKRIYKEWPELIKMSPKDIKLN